MSRYNPTPGWDPKKPVVPIGSDGALVSYPNYGGEWAELVPFDATLTLIDTARGRSSLIFRWETEDGRRWPMFASDVADLIRRGSFGEGGTVTGTWTASKKGANYGLKLAR